MSEERKKILGMVESGRITAEQAAELLDLVPKSSAADSEPLDGSETTDDAEQHSTAKTEPRERPYWRQALSVGSVIMLVAGAVLVDAYGRSGVSLWTWVFGWLPLFSGLLVVTVAAWARTARWIQMRITSPDEHLVLSVPLPLGLAASAIRVVRPFVPQMRHSGVDELILALRDGLPEDEPITIEVDDREEGEYVRIVID
jgi:hypothetical protein